VVIISAHGGVENAVAAMRRGAAHYITKPLDVAGLLVVLERALERRRLRAETAGLRRSIEERVNNMIGASAAMKPLFDLILRVAPSRTAVLVTGESGTGKELVAQAVHEHERVGGNQTIKVDVRIIAATNRDLAARVAAGAFREDLYYRLNVLTIDVPPLRARREDIPLLATHFLKRYAAENGKTISELSPDALARLDAYRWPGNVRELEHAIERAVVVCR